MFEIGQIVNEENYTEAAIWCNQHGAHMEAQNGTYIIASNTPAPEPTAEEKVAALESVYGLTRAVRTGLIALRAEGSVLDETLMARVDEIETLAAPLRKCV